MTRLSPSRAPRYLGREAIEALQKGGRRLTHAQRELEASKLVLSGLAAIVFLPVLTLVACSYLAPHIRQFLGL